MDVLQAFSWKFVSLHSSRPMHSALIKRLWGRSTVVRYNFNTGSTSVCLLKRCWNTLNDVAGRYIIQFITRHRHSPILGDLDRNLLHIARHDYGRSNEVYESLLASELWRLWMVSNAHCSGGVHKVNKQKIRRALRRKGITLTPDSEIRIPCPPTVLVTKRELRMELKNQLMHSFIPDIICRSIIRKAKFVKQGSVTIGNMLRNHGKLIAMMQQGDLPCVCHQYPHLPKRHGHVYVPSWEYSGFGERLVRCNMKSRARRVKSSWRVKLSIRKWWAKSLPKSLFPNVPCCLDDDTPKDPDSIFHPHYIREVLGHLKHLAIVGIDKCLGRSLLCCPVLFQKFYVETFPLLTDDDHFTPCNLNVRDAIAKIKMDGEAFDLFGSDLHGADIPTPYFLPKLKDVVADCKEVMTKKGK